MPVEKIILTGTVNGEVGYREGNQVLKEMRSERWFNHEITVISLNDHPGRGYLVPLGGDAKPPVRGSPAPRADQYVRQVSIF